MTDVVDEQWSRAALYADNTPAAPPYTLACTLTRTRLPYSRASTLPSPAPYLPSTSCIRHLFCQCIHFCTDEGGRGVGMGILYMTHMMAALPYLRACFFFCVSYYLVHAIMCAPTFHASLLLPLVPTVPPAFLLRDTYNLHTAVVRFLRPGFRILLPAAHTATAPPTGQAFRRTDGRGGRMVGLDRFVRALLHTRARAQKKECLPTGRQRKAMPMHGVWEAEGGGLSSRWRQCGCHLLFSHTCATPTHTTHHTPPPPRIYLGQLRVGGLGPTHLYCWVVLWGRQAHLLPWWHGHRHCTLLVFRRLAHFVRIPHLPYLPALRTGPTLPPALHAKAKSMKRLRGGIRWSDMLYVALTFWPATRTPRLALYNGEWQTTISVVCRPPCLPGD